MSKIAEIISNIEGLTVLELNDLVKQLEDKFGVTAAAPVAMMAGPSAAGSSAAAEVKDEFEVVLASSGDKKIQVLKVLREVTGLGLKEAKALVDGAPKTIKEGAKKEEAEDIKKKLEAEGAKVEIK